MQPFEEFASFLSNTECKAISHSTRLDIEVDKPNKLEFNFIDRKIETFVLHHLALVDYSHECDTS